MNYFNKYQELMKGRYGIFDDLNKFLYKIFIILLLLNIIFKNFILRIIYLILFFIIIYRFISKKIYIRSNENRKFLNIKNKIKNIKKTNNSNYIYKRCHKCKTKLRFSVPYKRGIKHSVCPKCKKRNTFIILKKDKIDIIKKK